MNAVTRRLMKLVGESGLWKVVGAIHTRLYRLTGGRLGQRTAGLDNLLLTTTGRKSGAQRTVPLTYMPDGDDYVLVASNGGADRHPAWWLNLSSNPAAEIQVGGATIAVLAHEADRQERARLWPMVKRYNPVYAMYEEITAREIPVVVLRSRAHA
jgi:deazaflavin-dependent oxidoreductase (nitroreductase family)